MTATRRFPKVLVALLLLAACETAAPEPRLELEGPARVTVDALGPVQGPSARFEQGGAPEGVTWKAAPESVARVEDGQVVAVGPGEAQVVGHWGEQTVTWTLLVEPATTVHFVEPPGSVAVGERVEVEVEVEVRAGGSRVEPGALSWTSSDPEVATVEPSGVLVGRSPGVTYVTVSSGSGQAMLELEVVQ